MLKSRPKNCSIWAALLLLGAMSCLAACAETIAPRSEYPDDFSMYGLLSPDRDTQYVYVSPIETVPTLGMPDALEGVTIASTDLGTGERRIWQDTVMVTASGRHEYLYTSVFRPDYGGRYRVGLYGGEGDRPASWVDVRVPPRATVDVVAANRDTVLVDIIAEAVRLFHVEVDYFVREGQFAPLHQRRSYRGRLAPTASGWRLPVRLSIDRYWVHGFYLAELDILSVNGCPLLDPTLKLGETRLHALVTDTAWTSPGPTLDPRVVSHLGTMENVQGGTGFVGVAYRINALLDMPQQAIEGACFIYCTEPYSCAEPRDPASIPRMPLMIHNPRVPASVRR